MTCGFHPLATRELTDAAQFYKARSPGLGSRFLDEVERVLALLQSYPEVGRPTAVGIRAFPTRRFPYSVVYRLPADELQVVALAHHRRRPFYWTARTG